MRIERAQLSDLFFLVFAVREERIINNNKLVGQNVQPSEIAIQIH